MNLLVSIYSALDPSHCYGNQGDKVTVISIHEKVAIVEGEDTNRFSVTLDKLSEKIVIPEVIVPLVEQVAMKPAVVFDTPLKPAKQTKTKKDLQPSLF